LANYISFAKDEIKLFVKGMVKRFAITVCTSDLILCELDYGTAILLGGVSISLLFLYGARSLYVVGTVVVVLVSGPILIFFNPVRIHRIFAFTDTNSNKLGDAYQLWQGMLGFTSGGL
jgi:cell division protein FtsW